MLSVQNFAIKLTRNDLLGSYRSTILMCVDLLAASVALSISLFLETGSIYGGTVFAGISNFSVYLLLVLITHGYVIKLSKIHRSLWTFIGAHELTRIVSAVFVSNVLSLFYLKLFDASLQNSLRFFVLFCSFNLLFMLSVRLTYRYLRESASYKRGINYNKRAIIIGSDEPGYILLKEIQRNQSLGSKVIGFVDSSRMGKRVSGFPILGGYKDIGSIVKKHRIDIAYIAKPNLSRIDRASIIDTLSELNIHVKVMHFDEVGLKDDVSKTIKNVSVDDLLGRGQVKLDQSEVGSYISNKVVLVTGAGGSIGGQLVREIINFAPTEIIMIDVNENGLYLLERELDFMKSEIKKIEKVVITSLVVNIREKRTVEEVFKTNKINVVFHAAAHKHVPLMERMPKEALKNNVFGTRDLIDISIKYHAERFIMISTDKAVNPTNVMGASKRLTEIILQSRAQGCTTKLAAVRFGNVLGSNGSVLPIFQEQIRKGGPITITDKRVTRYFMTIPEASQLVLQAGYYAKSGEIFVLDMGKPAKIKNLAEDLIKLSGLVPYQDIDIVEIGMRPGEKMFEELTLKTEDSKKTDNKLIYIVKSMNINPVQLEAALEELKKLTLENVLNTDVKSKLFDVIHSHHIINAKRSKSSNQKRIISKGISLVK